MTGKRRKKLYSYNSTFLWNNCFILRIVQETEAGNKAEGLKQFNRNASIIIYQEEVLR